MTKFTEVTCWRCNAHLGWMIYTGPGPSYYCNACREEMDREEEEEGQSDDDEA